MQQDTVMVRLVSIGDAGTRAALWQVWRNGSLQICERAVDQPTDLVVAGPSPVVDRLVAGQATALDVARLTFESPFEPGRHLNRPPMVAQLIHGDPAWQRLADSSLGSFSIEMRNYWRNEPVTYNFSAEQRSTSFDFGPVEGAEIQLGCEAREASRLLCARIELPDLGPATTMAGDLFALAATFSFFNSPFIAARSRPLWPALRLFEDFVGHLEAWCEGLHA